MSKSTIFEKMCKELKKRSKEDTRMEIVLAREKVEEYIENERDKYIQLKAEAESSLNTTESLGYTVSLLSFVVSTFAFIYSTVQGPENFIMEIFILIAFAIELCIILHLYYKMSYLNKWRKYILAVIDDYEPM